MTAIANVTMAGSVGLQVIRRDRWIPDELAAWRDWNPKSDLGKAVRGCLRYLPVEQAAELLERITSSLVIESSLALKVLRQQRAETPGAWAIVEDHGVVSNRVITTAGVNFLVAVWTGSGTLGNFKFHGLGTGTSAESISDTALVTELTTEYNPDGTRATGTTVTGASNNILSSVATNTLDGTPSGAIREHGLFSASTVGTLWDRTLFSSITLSSGDSLVSTYQVTCSAGG